MLTKNYSDSTKFITASSLARALQENADHHRRTYIETWYGCTGHQVPIFQSKSKEQIIISDENDKESLIASDMTARLQGSSSGGTSFLTAPALIKPDVRISRIRLTRILSVAGMRTVQLSIVHNRCRPRSCTRWA